MEQEDTVQYRRLFIALDIPEDAKDKLFLYRDAVPTKRMYHWEQKEKLHLTISFLGNVEVEKIPLIENILDEVAMFGKFSCFIPNFGFFGFLDKPKALYARVVSDQTLFRIEKYLSECLENLDILTDEKHFKPHVTLMKVKEKFEEGFIEAFTSVQFEKISFLAKEIVLYESELNQTGSIYKKLKTIYLS